MPGRPRSACYASLEQYDKALEARRLVEGRFKRLQMHLSASASVSVYAQDGAECVPAEAGLA